MHELSVMEHVLELAVSFGENNSAARITQIHLVAGSLSNIVPKWADLFFRMVAQGTIAEEAVLHFCVTPARIRCRKCGEETEFTRENMLFNCGHCGSDEISLVAGKEFRIESIEIVTSVHETPPQTCRNDTSRKGMISFYESGAGNSD